MDIYGRIKSLRENLNMTQEELAKKMGYKSRSTINKIEKGLRDIGQSQIIDFADALGVSPAYLMGWEDNTLEAIKDRIIPLEEGVKIPVLGNVAAGTPIFVTENYIGVEEISKAMAATGDFFGLQIKGDSMSPRISEGDIVIVRQQDYAETGDIVIAMVNGDSATCKKILLNDSGISLLSFNPSYEPMLFSKEEVINLPVTIIGKVVENRQKY